jgi:hypothetical protein
MQDMYVDFNLAQDTAAKVGMPVLILQRMQYSADVLRMRSVCIMFDSSKHGCLRRLSNIIAATLMIAQMSSPLQIQGIRQWMTNEYMHSGIRDDGAVILEKLLGYTRGVTALF